MKVFIEGSEENELLEFDDTNCEGANVSMRIFVDGNPMSREVCVSLHDLMRVLKAFLH